MLSKELDGDKILFLFKNEGPNKNTKTFSQEMKNEVLKQTVMLIKWQLYKLGRISAVLTKYPSNR